MRLAISVAVLILLSEHIASCLPAAASWTLKPPILNIN